MDLHAFYERSYSSSGAEAQRFAAWREMSARAKAEHVVRLAGRLAGSEARVLDVGCGDGAVIARLESLEPQWSFAGVEIAQRAVDLARARCPEAEISAYDGSALPFEPHSFDLAVLSHVLEHVTEPAATIAEAARVAHSLIIEVPLEANVSTRRESRRAIARSVGHIQRFSRRDVWALAAAAGLSVAGELSDPLGREAQMFFAASPRARTRAQLKWAVRAAVHAASPRAAHRLFTVHYACRCEPVPRASTARYAATVR